MRPITQCPKCGSERIAFAPDEAPAWAKKWTKCFACGKRWNLDGGPPKKMVEDDEEDVTEEREATPAPKRSGEDIVKLVMSLSKKEKSKPTVEPSTKEQPVMETQKISRRQCLAILKRDGTQCRSDPTKGSEFCKRHEGETARIPDRVPAVRATAPITLAEPTLVNVKPAQANDLNGNAITVLDSFIVRLQADLATLQGAKEVMERHG